MALAVGFVAGGTGVWLSQDGPDSGYRFRAERLLRAPPAEQPGPIRGPDRDANEQPAAEASAGAAGFGVSAEPGSEDLSTLLRQWARTDPAGFIDALPSLDFRNMQRADPEGPPYLYALRLASEADPRRALTVGESETGALGEWIRAAALEALAAEDPQAALDHLDDLGAGDLRDRLLGSIATGFAHADPESAARWLSTLRETDGAAFYPVIGAVAVVDLPWAIELDARALELDYGSSDYGDISWLENGLETNRQNPARIADAFASMQATGLLAKTLEWWVLRDPYGAIAWIHSQETISSWVVGGMAAELARRDYENAITLSSQFSPPVRAAWLESALGSAARFDLPGALEALERFRGGPLFDDVHSEILGTTFRTLGPAEAARVAGNTTPSSNLALQIARDWAETDSPAAADWVMSFEDESVRSTVLRSVIQSWSRRDAESAASWVLGIADETLRASMMPYVCPSAGTCAPRP